MIYDLATQIGKERFKRRCNELYGKGVLVELTDKSRHSDNQRRYLHLIIGYLAIEVGVSAEYAKSHYYKKAANPDTYIIETADPLTGEIHKELRSSSSLTKEEYALSIDRFRNWASQVAGIYLPEAGEESFLREIEAELSKNKQYL